MVFSILTQQLRSRNLVLYPASTNASDIIAFIIDDPNVIYEIQCKCISFPVADLFGNFDITTQAHSTTTGISGAELDGELVLQLLLPLKCIDISQDPENLMFRQM